MSWSIWPEQPFPPSLLYIYTTLLSDSASYTGGFYNALDWTYHGNNSSLASDMEGWGFTHRFAIQVLLLLALSALGNIDDPHLIS